jgi:hypothetical protein
MGCGGDGPERDGPEQDCGLRIEGGFALTKRRRGAPALLARPF